MEKTAAVGSSKASVPLLVFPYGERNENQAFYNIFEPNSPSYRMCIPELRRKTFWQKHSHQGWLIILCTSKDDADSQSIHNWKYGDCFLWNPVTLETVQLPSLLYWMNKPDEFELIDCVLSSPPRVLNGDADGGKDPIVLFLFARDNQKGELIEHVFLFCKPGDIQWKTQLLSGDIIEYHELVSLHCFQGKLYAMNMNNNQLEIEAQHQIGANDDNGLTLAITPFQVSFGTFFAFRGARDYPMGLTYFAECHDELFKIKMDYNDRGSESVIVSIIITRLDFSLMEWKVVNSLGDHVLFIGHNTAFCCSAADLGLARGFLYYTLDKDQGLYKFDVESTDDSVTLLGLKMPTSEVSFDWIMLPNGWGRKEDMLGEDEEKDEGVTKTSMISCNENEIAIHGEERNILMTRQLRGLCWFFLSFFNCFQHNEEEEEEIPWGILNEDMVKLIASYLHPLDYVHFRSVSKANREMLPVVKPGFLSSTETLETIYLSPWLVFPADTSSAIYYVVNPMHNNEKYLVKFSEFLIGATIRFQRGGWLLMSREEELFFYNPFARETIILPDFPGRYCNSDISFSSLPTASDCIVFGIEVTGLGNDVTIYLIKRGEQDWHAHENHDIAKYSPLLNTPTLFQDFFLSVGYDGTLGEIVTDDDPYTDVMEQPCAQFNDSYPTFLVECEGDLLMVKLGPSVRIFEMDFSEMEWVKVESSGNYMLFISDILCFSAIAPDSQMANKVYFPRLWLDGEGILYYSLETGSYHSFGGAMNSAKNIYGTKGWHSNCTWIQPNWSKSTPRELDWLKSPP